MSKHDHYQQLRKEVKLIAIFLLQLPLLSISKPKTVFPVCIPKADNTPHGFRINGLIGFRSNKIHRKMLVQISSRLYYARSPWNSSPANHKNLSLFLCFVYSARVLFLSSAFCFSSTSSNCEVSLRS